MDRRRTCHGPVQRQLIKMADNIVSACMEQRVVMKFLVKEGAKPADIYSRLQAHYGDETLSRSKTFEWCKRFKDGRTSFSDDPDRGGSQPTAAIPVNIQRVKSLIMDNRSITVFWVMCMRLRGKKRPGLITNGVPFLQDNALPHTAQRTTCTLQQLGWEVLPHPPYSPDLAPSDFHLFEPPKGVPRRSAFQHWWRSEAGLS